MKKYGLFLAVICIFCLSATSYGMVVFDNTFVRETGVPVTEVFHFEAVNGPATIRLTSGSLEDSTVEKVSSSEVKVNEEVVFGPSNFNQNVDYLEQKISLEDQNSIQIILKGKPGGQIIIQITQDRILFKKQGKLPEFEYRNTSRDNSQYVELRTGFSCLANAWHPS